VAGVNAQRIAKGDQLDVVTEQLLLDEPTSALDPISTEYSETGSTLLYSLFSLWKGGFIQAHGFSCLTYIVHAFWSYPSNQAHDLSYGAALILVVTVLLLLIGVRVIVARTQRHAEGRTR